MVENVNIWSKELTRELVLRLARGGGDTVGFVDGDGTSAGHFFLQRRDASLEKNSEILLRKRPIVLQCEVNYPRLENLVGGERRCGLGTGHALQMKRTDKLSCNYWSTSVIIAFGHRPLRLEGITKSGNPALPRLGR